MTLLVIALGFILILVAVSLLFVERPTSGTDWPSLIATCLMFTTLILFSWNWQYGKFLNKHGIYYLSQTHGGMLTTAFHIIIFVVMVAFVWKHRDEGN